MSWGHHLLFIPLEKRDSAQGALSDFFAKDEKK
jgi:hypothetical protein